MVVSACCLDGIDEFATSELNPVCLAGFDRFQVSRDGKRSITASKFRMQGCELNIMKPHCGLGLCEDPMHSKWFRVRQICLGRHLLLWAESHERSLCITARPSEVLVEVKVRCEWEPCLHSRRSCSAVVVVK